MNILGLNFEFQIDGGFLIQLCEKRLFLLLPVEKSDDVITFPKYRLDFDSPYSSNIK